MEHVRGENIAFRYNGQTENLLEKVSFSLDDSGQIGLVGDNGSGKTTLLEIIRGRLKISSGKLHKGRETTVGYLPQEVRLKEKSIVRDYLWQALDSLYSLRKKAEETEESSAEYADIIAEYYKQGGGQFDIHIKKILAGFGIGEDRFKAPVSKLSGGEKTKIAMARILLRRPDIMLLDEPTNHLEIASLEWLEQHLRSGSTPYIVISHDRRFLDNCVDEIWELHDRTLKVYAGSYSFYQQERELSIKRQFHEYEKQQAKIKQLRKAAGQRRQEASKIEKFKLSRSVTKKGGICKRDEGSGRSGADSAGKMRSAKAVEKRIQMMIEKDSVEKPSLERKRKITFETSTLKNRIVLRIKKLGRRFGRRAIFKDINLSVLNKARIGVIGCNGSGKSTFLNIITGNLKATSGTFQWAPRAKIGYFSQEHETLDLSKSILDEVLQGKSEDQTRARTILGRLNIRRDKVYQKIDSLSLGERSKVALAKILFSDVNVLVLDEPTNHIELLAREAFENALEDYGGTVIIASHDRYLLDRVATEIFDIEQNRHFEGSYSEYTEQSV
jgi:ATP-binding cassette subfamily F protein 3